MSRRLQRVRIAVALSLAAAAVGVRAARADTDDAVAAIKSADARAREVLEDSATDAKRAEVEQSVAKHLRTVFDMRKLAAKALDRHWDSMSSSQRDNIVDLLETLVIRAHIKFVRKYGRFPVDYKKPKTKGDTVVVSTVVRVVRRRRKAAIHVDYVLAKDGDKWRIQDMVTDSVSLVANYRSQFNRVIAKSGVDGLITTLERKAEEAN